MPRKVGTPKEPVVEKQDTIPVFDYDSVQKDILNGNMAEALGDDRPVFVTDEETDSTMTLNPPEVSQGRGLTPANYIEKRPGDGFRDASRLENPTPPVQVKTEEFVSDKAAKAAMPAIGVAPKHAKPASKIDLENLDESMIMDLPMIKAATFEIMDMLNLKPKDKTLRFRWGNCKNFVAGNLARYIALGYRMADIDDVDQSKVAVDPSMIEGTQVKYYDIILLKIPVIRLMELYKANIIKSVNRLARFKERGIKEANRQFASDLQSSPGLVNGYNKVKEALGGEDPVQFYSPGVKDLVGRVEELN